MSQEIQTRADMVATLTPRVAMVGGDGIVPRSALEIGGGWHVTVAREASVGEAVPVYSGDSPEPEQRYVAAVHGSWGVVLLAPDSKNTTVPATVPESLAAEAAAGRLGEETITVAYPSPEGREVRVAALRCIGHDGSYLQTDGSPFPGFAGAPVFSAQGSLLGITLTGAGGNDSLVLPTERLADWLKHPASADSSDEAKRAALGVSVQPVAIPAGTIEGESARRAVMVMDVVSDEGAGGLRFGDAILSVGGVATTDPSELRTALASTTPGESVEVLVVRGGEVVTVTHATVDAASLEESGDGHVHHHGHRHGHQHAHGHRHAHGHHQARRRMWAASQMSG